MKNRNIIASVPGSKFRFLYLTVFLLSLALRISLVMVNRDANDDHLEVTRMMLHTGSLPTGDQCWECFQPKLYHAALAVSFRLAGILDPDLQVLFANLVSFLAGALTLASMGCFLRGLPFPPSHLLLAFALVAFNPNFIGITAQATNDSLLILFSTLALLLFNSFLLGDTSTHFSLAILFTALAISTKSSGIIIFLAILLVLLLRSAFEPARRVHFAFLALVHVIAVLMLVVSNPLNQYIVNHRLFGTPLLLNMERRPLPFFNKPTSYANPGILSIKDGFLTFKYIQLMAHPRIEDSIEGNLQHRTSLWTQLYARAHSVNFDNWPPSWSTSSGSIFPLVRSIFLLALLPTGLVLLGAFLQIWRLMRAIWHRDLPTATGLQFGLHPLAMVGCIVFVAFYTLLYREFSVMKAIFLLPALPAYPLAFLVAIENRPPWFNHLVTATSLTLIGLYCADVISLIIRLA